jgi:phage terminase large subunit-like protein
LSTLSLSLADIEKVEKWQKYNRIELMFPETGAYNRSLYPKHMEFFKATAEHKEVAFIAGNRCITPWTFLANNRTALSAVCDSEFDVQSWDGERQCTARASGGFLKGILPAFRVVLDNGQFFDCTGEHRVLTSEGYLGLSQLMSLSGGLRLTRKREDYQASCVADGYLCDPRLPLAEDNAQALFPAQDAALRHSRIIWPGDEEGHRLQRIHASLSSDRLSTPDDFLRLAALFEPFLIASCDKSSLPLSGHIREFLQCLAEYGLEQLALQLSDNPVSAFLSKICDRGVLEKMLPSGEESLKLEQSLSVFSFERSFQELQGSEQHTAIFFPLSHPSLVGGGKIRIIVPLGLQPIIDFTVPEFKNYLAAGVFHHNTGKSEAIVYAATLFLTGKYPSWWMGRRFDKPVNILVAGENSKLVRDSIQAKFFGASGERGTGMIPKDLIIDTTSKAGTADAVDTVHVKHVSGVSTMGFSSYDSGREAFQATTRDVILLDEEPPMAIYTECLIRTMTTKGLVMAALTPLRGITELVRYFMSAEQISDRARHE